MTIVRYQSLVLVFDVSEKPLKVRVLLTFSGLVCLSIKAQDSFVYYKSPSLCRLILKIHF